MSVVHYVARDKERTSACVAMTSVVVDGDGGRLEGPLALAAGPGALSVVAQSGSYQTRAEAEPNHHDPSASVM